MEALSPYISKVLRTYFQNTSFRTTDLCTFGMHMLLVIDPSHAYYFQKYGTSGNTFEGTSGCTSQ